MWGNPNAGREDRHRPFVIPGTHTAASIREQDVVIPATDSRGATVGIRAKVTPAVDRAMAAVVESGRFPFTCQADFIRSAITRLLNDCAAMTGTAETLMAVVNLQRDTQSQYIIESEIEDLFATQVLLCQQAAQDGEAFEAQRLAMGLRHRIESLPDSVWKRRCLSRFKTTFKGFISIDDLGASEQAQQTVNGGIAYPSNLGFSPDPNTQGTNRVAPIDRVKLAHRVLLNRFED